MVELFYAIFHSHAIRRKWGPVKARREGNPKAMLVGKLELNPMDLFDPQRIDSVNLKLLNLLKILQLRFYSAETMQFSIFKHIL